MMWKVVPFFLLPLYRNVNWFICQDVRRQRRSRREKNPRSLIEYESFQAIAVCHRGGRTDGRKEFFPASHHQEVCNEVKCKRMDDNYSPRSSFGGVIYIKLLSMFIRFASFRQCLTIRSLIDLQTIAGNKLTLYAFHQFLWSTELRWLCKWRRWLRGGGREEIKERNKKRQSDFNEKKLLVALDLQRWWVSSSGGATTNHRISIWFYCLRVEQRKRENESKGNFSILLED